MQSLLDSRQCPSSSFTLIFDISVWNFATFPRTIAGQKLVHSHQLILYLSHVVVWLVFLLLSQKIVFIDDSFYVAALCSCFQSTVFAADSTYSEPIFPPSNPLSLRIVFIADSIYIGPIFLPTDPLFQKLSIISGTPSIVLTGTMFLGGFHLSSPFICFSVLFKRSFWVFSGESAISDFVDCRFFTCIRLQLSTLYRNETGVIDPLPQWLVLHVECLRPFTGKSFLHTYIDRVAVHTISVRLAQVHPNYNQRVW